MKENDKRRNRPAISCLLCRKRKIKCDREQPCSNCVRSKVTECIYGKHEPDEIIPHGCSMGAASTPSSSNADLRQEKPVLSVQKFKDTPTPNTQYSATSDESRNLKRKIHDLEEEISSMRPPPVPQSTPMSQIETTTSTIGGTFYLEHQPGDGVAPTVPRGVTHKTRLFGPSHWFVSGVQLMREVVEALEPPKSQQNLQTEWCTLRDMQKCKTISREVKASWAGRPWPKSSLPSLPSKIVADALVDCYLRTFETVYRVLHVPTFRKAYDALWQSDNKVDESFLVQLKLVLALGAITYDETFSLKPAAIRWTREAQLYASEPKAKPRLNFTSLQTGVLLLMAHDLVGTSGDHPWVAIAALYRRAIQMGFHRDPDNLPPTPRHVAEMRRRLWNTILELSLQSSMDAGGPPLVSMEDFDTKMPGNFDDEQLELEDSQPKPVGEFSHMSVACALRKVFPQRLAVLKFLNNPKAISTYKETLRYDTELRTAFKSIVQDLQNVGQSRDTGKPQSSLSAFELQAVNFLMNKYLVTLHLPYHLASMHESTYAYSRRVIIDTELKIWHAACPSKSSESTLGTNPATVDTGDLARLIMCSHGFFKLCTIQAIMHIGSDLRAQTKEDAGLGPIQTRPDMVAALKDAKAWSKRVLEAGETNPKGFMLSSVLYEEISATIEGLPWAKVVERMVAKLEETSAAAVPYLEKLAAATTLDQADGAGYELQQVSLANNANNLEDWDFMSVDAMFNSNNSTSLPMNWLINGDLNYPMPSLW